MAPPSVLLSFFVAALCLSAVAGEIAGDGEGFVIRQVTDDHIINAELHFSAFVRHYGKAYSSAEEHAYRLSVFKSNLHRARRHQILDPTAIHGVTEFSDLTEEEFQQRYLGLRSPRSLGGVDKANKAPILPTNDLPENFDWRDHGAVTPVKNQVRSATFMCLFLVIGFRSVLISEYVISVGRVLAGPVGPLVRPEH